MRIPARFIAGVTGRALPGRKWPFSRVRIHRRAGHRVPAGFIVIKPGLYSARDLQTLGRFLDGLLAGKKSSPSP